MVIVSFRYNFLDKGGSNVTWIWNVREGDKAEQGWCESVNDRIVLDTDHHCGLGSNFTSTDDIGCTEVQLSNLHNFTRLIYFTILSTYVEAASDEGCTTKYGEHCTFPFKYEADGPDLYECTTSGGDSRSNAWCATSVNTDKTYDNWDYCKDVYCKHNTSDSGKFRLLLYFLESKRSGKVNTDVPEAQKCAHPRNTSHYIA